MKRSVRPRPLSPKAKRIIVTGCILLAVALLVYAEAIRPAQDAHHYTKLLDTSSKPVSHCFEQLAKTTTLDIYYAPDVPIATKQDDAKLILAQINDCRGSLAVFNDNSHKLLRLSLAGYFGSYKQAKIYQRQAYDVVGQSTDVLNQYEELATFLSNYYGHLAAFDSYTKGLTNGSSYFSSARLKTMEQQASDMRQRAATVRTMDSPAEFATTKQETADMLSNAADGIDALVNGYRIGNDYSVDAGYKQVDQAVAAYDSHVMNLPFDQLIKSYVPQQVDQLPAKIDNLLTAASE